MTLDGGENSSLGDNFAAAEALDKCEKGNADPGTPTPRCSALGVAAGVSGLVTSPDVARFAGAFGAELVETESDEIEWVGAELVETGWVGADWGGTELFDDANTDA
ncbi:hypothetical protein EH165_07480 [Nakamurella antarctica]|uniref:Uncharacterized protein n=1 Tax=Nakamurella antarctica TaxID=1902245 RepID=A0A3G8ZMD5_9ACTN|nr:hypothetical protein [Nakamurella antarctica]AZI58005.1 hypothetical protein EH165_07480 [Nakamurella antarctica]